MKLHILELVRSDMQTSHMHTCKLHICLYIQKNLKVLVVWLQAYLCSSLSALSECVCTHVY